MSKSTVLRDIGVFAIIFFPLTFFFEWLLIAFEAAPSKTIPIIMWTVGLAAFATMRLRKIPLSNLGWQWGPARYHLIALALPVVYGGISYLLAASMGLIQFAGENELSGFRDAAGFEELAIIPGLALALLITLLGLLPGAFVRALGEEIGWRGFLTPRMNVAFGFILGSVITGIVWASWHFPAIFWGPYNGSGDASIEAACFLVMVIAKCGVYAWLRMISGSFWPAATLHAAHNLIIQSGFDALTTRGANEVTMVGEFGVVTAVITVLITLPFWVLGVRLWQKHSREAVATA